MNYVYTDLGCYNGDSILSFYQRHDLPVSQDQFSILAYDPNPNFESIWNRLRVAFPNVIFSNLAAYTDNEVRQFTVDLNKLAYGSTLEKSKKNWGNGKVIKTQCFDFSQWVKQFEHDYLIVKMDIEGAEFPVLKKMLADNTIRYMNQLWVEVHPNKVRDYTTFDAQELIHEIEKQIKVELWH